MDLDELIRRLQQLIESHEETAVEDPGARNFRCVDCRACYDCRFCVACDGCQECTYCEECVDCTGCTQCRRSLACQASSYCEDCRDCTGSRYLTLCVRCEDCVHCLACVGLSGAEFYVLNEPMGRREYFDALKRAQEQMQARAARGWRPEPIGLSSADPEAPETAAADDWLEEPAPDPGPEEPVDERSSSHTRRPSPPERPETSLRRARPPPRGRS